MFSTKVLRSRGGCSFCRKRRKKCDETKPTCRLCREKNLVCSWPDLSVMKDGRGRRRIPVIINSPESSHSSENSISEDSASPSDAVTPATPKVNRTIPIYTASLPSPDNRFARADSDSFFLNTYSYGFTLAILLPTNLPQLVDEQYLQHLSVNIPELKDTICACGASSAAFTNHKSHELAAQKYYARGVSGLRRRLASGELKGTEDWLLGMIVLLSVFETWRADSFAPIAWDHLGGAIQVIKARAKAPPKHQQTLFDVVMAESVLFHVSTCSITSPAAADAPADAEFWRMLEQIFQLADEMDPLQEYSNLVLGISRDIYRLVFDLSKLSKKTPHLSLDDLNELQRLQAALAAWHAKLNAGKDEDDAAAAQEDPYYHLARLYIVAAEFLFDWTASTSPLARGKQDARQQSLSAQRASRASRARAILQGLDLSEYDSFSFAARWPLLILGHALTTAEDMKMVRYFLERTWSKTGCGDILRSLRKLIIFWGQTNNNNETDINIDGRDRLDSLLGRGSFESCL